MVSVIIPAYDEEKTIGEVVRSVIGHPRVREVIVIDDGSSDHTAAQARIAGALVILKTTNGGKAQALDLGVRASSGGVILFLDADVLGITHSHIDLLLEPVLRGQYSMFVGVRERKIYWLNKLWRISPILGGERALTRSLWERVPRHYKERFEIEIALNYFAKNHEHGMAFSLLRDVNHVVKEQKYGFRRGFVARLKMIVDILKVSIKLYILRLEK
jgi:polyprenyl-phospho-N-acetylgalactosaminyl synthase